MARMFDDVGEFHQKFALPNYGDNLKPHLLDESTYRFRYEFLREELTEINDAQAAGDLEKFLDGLIDLVYVACGTAHLAHLPFNRGWALVHAANMLKERASSAGDPRSTRKHSLDVIKPPGWKPPDLKPLLILP